MEPLISVIIPVYNVEKYLPSCLESVLNQTYKNLEVLLIDDGSRDSSGLICDQYAQKDSRIRVIHQENAGVAAARNAGVQSFTGEFVMFVDSDDTIALNAVQVLYNRLITDGSDLAIAKHVVVQPDGAIIDAGKQTCWMKNAYLTREQCLRLLAENKHFAHALWAKMYRKEVMTGICFPELTSGEDAWVFPQYISKCESVSIEETVIYHYWNRAGSITRAADEKTKQDGLTGNLHVLDFYLSSGYIASARAWFAYAMIGAAKIKDKAAGRALFEQKFSKRDMRMLLKGQTLKVKMKWVSMHIPVIYTIIRGIKDLFGMK